jgi:superfamily II DNA or RNA helicase
VARRSSVNRRKKRNKARGGYQRPRISLRSSGTASIEELSGTLEFYRHGYALVPQARDRRPEVAFLAMNGRGGLSQACSCSVRGSKRCAHLRKLKSLVEQLAWLYGDMEPQDCFEQSVWYRMQSVLVDGRAKPARSVAVVPAGSGSGRMVRIVDEDRETLAVYLSSGPDLDRLLERLLHSEGRDKLPSRADLLAELMELTATQNERMMQKHGAWTIGQARARSFWFRLAYHAFREFGNCSAQFSASIDEETGAFTVEVSVPGRGPVFRLWVPRHRVVTFLHALGNDLPGRRLLPVHPGRARTRVLLQKAPGDGLTAEPVVCLADTAGKECCYALADLDRFLYGSHVYIPEAKILTRLEPDGHDANRLGVSSRVSLDRSAVASFLEKLTATSGGNISEAVRGLRLIDSFDRLEVEPRAIDRDWCWISARYGSGSQEISLADIIRTRARGQRFVWLEDGFVDCSSPAFSPFHPSPDGEPEEPEAESGRGVRMSARDLLRLAAQGDWTVRVRGEGQMSGRLRRLLDLRPAGPLEPLRGLASSLRAYQARGVEWLLCLFENGLGGLLCDDMGLGKTHQVIGLMLAMKEQRGAKGPYLVVCPATVLSHWERIVGVHAPGLRAAAFYGADRDLAGILAECDLVITTYGIMRNEIDSLQRVDFDLVVFDEIQHIKNPETLSHLAARRIRARICLGLTGTPIENSLQDLKALFDLVLPGYLGTDREFHARLADDGAARRRLRAWIAPFTLRRLKQTVLDELPPKIEDTRTCTLSDDQVKLYRDAVDSRGRDLVAVLKRKDRPVPYLHIFAVLNILKQICDHPALVAGKPEKYRDYCSGKWDLFTELLEESLGSGQKVVVYSQYLGMLDIIAHHLSRQDVGFVTLSGKSRKRGEIISKFCDDPSCRVFVGSLKAGGVGIDLVSASVVIHYDRWWNAAREDQATDRVHRIGQRRGVQVFKLVTSGTLEEKIADIIEHKRRLLTSTVPEDDPGVLKSFSRDDLVRLLRAV